MSQWYLSYGGQQVGPMSLAEASKRARANPNGHAWREGFPEWLPINDVAELTTLGSSIGPPPARAEARPGRPDATAPLPCPPHG